MKHFTGYFKKKGQKPIFTHCFASIYFLTFVCLIGEQEQKLES